MQVKDDEDPIDDPLLTRQSAWSGSGCFAAAFALIAASLGWRWARQPLQQAATQTSVAADEVLLQNDSE